MLRDFYRKRNGQTTTEYIVILSIIVVGVFVLFKSQIGQQLKTKIVNIGQGIQNAQ